MPPAVKTKVTDQLWTLEELLGLIDRAEAGRLGPGREPQGL
jgi:hypothetical protein